MVELRALAYFVTACRSGSLGLAAAELGVAVSTLSTTLKALGEDLGVTLFRRINNNLHPTAAARALLRGAEPLLVAEMFARRFLATSSRVKPKRLIVDVGLSFTIGGISEALRCAIDKTGAERPDVFVDAVWTDEKDVPHIGGLAGERMEEQGHLSIGMIGPGRGPKSATNLVSDFWTFACRLPAGTRHHPAATDLTSGRIVVPSLSASLIEQADRYFTRNKITGVRFLNDHPGDLPRTIDDYPDAAVFIPRSLASARLGLLNVVTVPPTEPLEIQIAIRAMSPNAVTAVFTRHLRHALENKERARVEHPTISMRQVHYFRLVHRLRRVSGAARATSISQPALTEQLHKLEALVGTPLFDRQRDGVVPTAKGERFAVAAELIDRAFRRLQSPDAGTTLPSRRMTVGILPSVNQHGFLVNRISEAIIEVQAGHPNLKLLIQEAPNGTLQDWVMRGLVGVAIVETALPHMPRLPLGSSEDLAVIVYARHKMIPDGPVRLADLARLRLALPTNRSGLRLLLDTAAEARGLKIIPDMEVDALPMAVAMLARLPICTVLPPSAVASEIAAGLLVAHPIIDPAISRRLFAIYSAERPLSKTERALVTSLRRTLAYA
jgi:LysR family nitrogen assimilation transcriptional regulator